MRLRDSYFPPGEPLNRFLEACGETAATAPVSGEQLLRRPGITLDRLWEFSPPEEALDFETREQVEIRVKYSGYLEREAKTIERFEKAEKLRIPDELDYDSIPGLPRESRQRLKEVRPLTFGQAARVPGVRSGDIAVLHIYLVKLQKSNQTGKEIRE